MSQRDNAACLESLDNFLNHVLQAPIMEGLVSIRQQGKEIAQTNGGDEMSEVDVTKQLLKDVRNWTQVLLDEEVRRIVQQVPFLQKLLTALFVMKVKVLSVINMRKDTEEFPLTIPANATFIHHVYIQCANVLLDNESILEEMPIVHLSPLVKEGIRKACFACIAWSDLLAWGLDGIDINDVIKNVLQDDPKNESNAGEENTSSQFETEQVDAAQNEANDNEFHDLANEEKMNESEENDPNSNEQQSPEEEKSLFDYEASSSSDASSVTSDSSPPNPSDAVGEAPAGEEPAPDGMADTKRIADSPSFF
tara:strand:+ start:163 stop:1086 length:924 start_codon:yes stop_codon:yes gene_type:complete